MWVQELVLSNVEETVSERCHVPPEYVEDLGNVPVAVGEPAVSV
jgi:hypothetical protein